MYVCVCVAHISTCTTYSGPDKLQSVVSQLSLIAEIRSFPSKNPLWLIVLRSVVSEIDKCGRNCFQECQLAGCRWRSLACADPANFRQPEPFGCWDVELHPLIWVMLWCEGWILVNGTHCYARHRIIIFLWHWVTLCVKAQWTVAWSCHSTAVQVCSQVAVLALLITGRDIPLWTSPFALPAM